VTFIRRQAIWQVVPYSAKSGSLRAVLAENMVASIRGTAQGRHVPTGDPSVYFVVGSKTWNGTSFAPLARLVQPGKALNLQDTAEQL